tara:strand:- start:27 stop:239 length:213 start_codon:yes stop_codon:yes gene_type:complete
MVVQLLLHLLLLDNLVLILLRLLPEKHLLEKLYKVLTQFLEILYILQLQLRHLQNLMHHLHQLLLNNLLN